MATIAYFITSLSVGGAQQALLNLATSRFSASYQPYVIALVAVDGLQQPFAAAGIPVYELGLNRLSRLPWLPLRLMQLMAKIKPQVIHGWMHHGNLVATLAWLLAGCRPTLLWGMHHTPEQATLERAQHALVLTLGRWLARFPQHIVYVSQRSLQRHTELGYAPQRARVIPNGIPVAAAVSQQAEHYRSVRAELGLASDALVIGSLTRAVPEKDLPNLFAAIADFQQHGGHARFVLAGEGMDASNPAIKALMATLPKPAQVHLLGVRRDAPRLIAAFDLATLASQREALPLFLAEAMAQGVPCVATDVGDIPALVAETGRIVPAQDPQALAQGWQQLLALSPAQRQQLGQQAQQRVSGCYSLEAVIRTYHEILATPGEVSPFAATQHLH